MEEEIKRLKEIIRAYDEFEDRIIDLAHKSGNLALEDALSELKEQLKELE